MHAPVADRKIELTPKHRAERTDVDARIARMRVRFIRPQRRTATRSDQCPDRIVVVELAKAAGVGARSLKVYGLALEHKHVPEIEAYGGLTERPVFVKAYGSDRQAIVLTIGLHAQMLPADGSGVRIHECLMERYCDVAHVRVLGMWSDAKMT
ncbi:hypothetical protein BH11PSE13_BH11PSE13_07420 [soil metagenome]